MKRIAAAFAAGTAVVLVGAVPAGAGGSPQTVSGPRPDGAGSGERPDSRSGVTAAPGPVAVAPPRYTSVTRLAPGVVFKTFETSGIGGPVLGDLLDVDLGAPGVRVGLLHPSSVAARRTVSRMADTQDALAGVN